jgi:hypothetical protein
VLVAYRQFTLQADGDPDALTIDLPWDDPSDIAVAGGPGGVLFRSAANDHYPLVRIEQWSGEPPRSQESWETTRESAFTVPAGPQVILSSLFGPDEDAPEITLPGPGRYLARAYVRGCQEASTREEAEFFHGLEQWLVQIWPAG